MRLFLAIELPEPVRAELVRAQDRIAPVLVESHASITRAANLHITLKFLGEVGDKDVPKLCESLAHVSVPGAIELSASGIECFPPRGPVRIVAAAMSGSEGPVRALHDAVEQRCHYLGFERETRKYRPHVTLARARRPLRGDARERLASASMEVFPGTRFPVTEFVMMCSTLKSTGSEYTVAARFRLGG